MQGLVSVTLLVVTVFVLSSSIHACKKHVVTWNGYKNLYYKVLYKVSEDISVNNTW